MGNFVKLSQLFSESASEYKDDYAPKKRDLQIADLAAAIKRDCSQFVKAYTAVKSAFILRGMGPGGYSEPPNSDFPHVLTGKIRPDRMPMFMHAHYHSLLLRAFARLGIEANRGNSFFCTTNAGIASEWGQVYVMFFHDNFSNTVFTKVQTEYVFDKLFKFIGDLEDDNIDLKSPEAVELTQGKLEELGITDTMSLEKILINKTEDILIKAGGYYAVAYNNAPQRQYVADLMKEFYK